MRRGRCRKEQVIGVLEAHPCWAYQRSRNAGKILLRPKSRREAVNCAMKERRHSQRRVCSLVGIDPRIYRYRSSRPDDGELGRGYGSLPLYVAAPSIGGRTCCLRGKGRAAPQEALTALQGGEADRAQAGPPALSREHED